MTAVASRLTDLLRDVFDNDEIELSDEMTAADVEGWDSMGNVRLFLAIEQEFGLRFGASEIGAIKNIGELIAAIERKSR
ncbi:acyl carrier protein [Paucibacter sp. APW11]|uniref:Acyl carrier protein n=1 Tax=Roseateles aquae TaxID=3077235 RepID=A0ABU3PG31_9BURK|nr:acyl carrier protein [Paucibacter sp. APW11]MDT9000886.1 acyl carrier protein [Paucibacter sp. APW11]